MHKLLAQQLIKATDESGSVDYAKLTGLVTAAYEEFDRDRRRTERSMSMMFEEIEAIQHNLEQHRGRAHQGAAGAGKRIARPEHALRRRLSNMSQGLVMFDGDARLVMCNRRYIDMYGLEPDSVRIGTHTARST